MQKFQAISAAYTKLVSTEDVYDEIPTVSWVEERERERERKRER